MLAIAGLSNPAVLPVGAGDVAAQWGKFDDNRRDSQAATQPWRPGTVNLLVGVDRALSDGALATLLATVVEAKTATLCSVADVPGTTSDAVGASLRSRYGDGPPTPASAEHGVVTDRQSDVGPP